jgi:tetratricopeptide (TPR) repeat protein
MRLKQDYGKGLLAYQQALRAAPDAPGLHFNVGDVDYQMLKYPEAREELEKELKINPYHALANFELGDIEIKQGRIEEGMSYLDRALKLDPALAEAHRSLARGLLAEKRHDNAIRELLWLTKADPSDRTAHAMLSSAYRQMGRLQEAQDEAAISQKLLQDQATSPHFSPRPFPPKFWTAAARCRFPSPRLVAANHQSLTSQRQKKGSEIPHSESWLCARGESPHPPGAPFATLPDTIKSGNRCRFLNCS